MDNPAEGRQVPAFLKIARPIVLRLLYGLLALVFISFVTFIADELAPGDAATILAGDKATEQQVERIRQEMGLNRPWPERYVEFAINAAQFDFGRSYFGTKEEVSSLLADKVPMTASVALMAISLASVVGILLGTVAAVYRTKWPDSVLLVVSTLGVTVPAFVLAPFMQYIFANQLNVLPSGWTVNRIASDFYYLVMPVTILAARPAALLTRLTRASMIDTFQQEFIKTATAKGVPPMRLITRHALRNAILPVITVIGTTFGFLLTGSFAIETIFDIPGIGRAGILAIRLGDMPQIQGIILITGAMFILINLIVDILLPILDPRIREAQI